MHILVTGNTGRIGRWVVARLLEAGHTLRTLDKAAQFRQNDWEHLPGDICDSALVRRATQGMDAVVHLAAVPGNLPGYEEMLYRTNLQGTWNVLLACAEAGVSRVVNFSSINALGHAEPTHGELYLPLDDAIPHHPAQPYFISKHIGEEFCQAYATLHDLVAISLRPTMVLQPASEEERWWDFLTEERQAFYATRDFWSYVDVRDVSEAVLLSLTAPVTGHQGFLLTADDTHASLTSAELVQKYYSHLPWPNIPQDEYLAGNPNRSLVDCKRANEVLNWQPKFSHRRPENP